MVSLLLVPTLLYASAAPETAKADPFQAALVEAMHHFAEEGQVAHLRAVLDKYSKLRDARRGRQLGKPTHGDDYTPLQTAARRGEAKVVALLIEKGADLDAVPGY